ncbi:hypothetical protein AC1031_002638 [Aphanomyces cochlioides]|nr:hypothetical protein AC1031_002638 [Aphanomyces cochlioides]
MDPRHGITRRTTRYAPILGSLCPGFSLLTPRRSKSIWKGVWLFIQVAVDPSWVRHIAIVMLNAPCRTLMAWVAKEIRARGGVFEKRTLSSLNDLDCHLVVNCSGLGARQLVGDSAVYPVRGQVIKVFNPDINQFFLSECDGHCTYILPRPGGEVILGGTVQAHNWSLENNDKDVDEIMTRCSALLPQVKNSRVLHAKTGLRPANANGTRVELDPKRTQKGAWVVHNYGHGGSGHTIHRGCAMDVVQLVKSLASKL